MLIATHKKKPSDFWFLSKPEYFAYSSLELECSNMSQYCLHNMTATYFELPSKQQLPLPTQELYHFIYCHTDRNNSVWWFNFFYKFINLYLWIFLFIYLINNFTQNIFWFSFIYLKTMVESSYVWVCIAFSRFIYYALWNLCLKTA